MRVLESLGTPTLANTYRCRGHLKFGNVGFSVSFYIFAGFIKGFSLHFPACLSSSCPSYQDSVVVASCIACLAWSITSIVSEMSSYVVSICHTFLAVCAKGRKNEQTLMSIKSDLGYMATVSYFWRSGSLSLSDVEAVKFHLYASSFMAAGQLGFPLHWGGGSWAESPVGSPQVKGV